MSLSLRTLLIFSWIVLSLELAASASAWQPGPESVVVIANTEVEGSEEVARAYLKARDIPEKHLILIDSAASGGISREAFNADVRNPILEALINRGLINALRGSVDTFGRLEPILIASDITYMVLCYGVPYRVGGERGDDLEIRRKVVGGLAERFSSGPLSKSSASVDAELSLLLRKDVPFRGYVPNPYFRQNSPLPRNNILKVTRLDGPTVEDALAIIENSLEGERRGLIGRAYVDEDGRGGAYAAGNQWLKGTAETFRKLGFDLSHNTEGAEFDLTDRIDAPVLYAGWYAGTVNGPFTLPGFRFPPGAVAAHLHSFSAADLRSAEKGWVGPFVARGVSATFGNVGEPYLYLTHHFDAYFGALAAGWNVADAAYAALPGLSWMGIAIGDPLYRPFAKSLEEQLADAGDNSPNLNDQYLWLRQINLTLQSEGADAALALADKAMLRAPGPALALRKADLLEHEGHRGKARRTLKFMRELEPVETLSLGLHTEAAQRFLSLGHPLAAVEVYEQVLAKPLPEDIRKAFIRRALPAARQAGIRQLVQSWSLALAAPPPEANSDPRSETPDTP